MARVVIAITAHPTTRVDGAPLPLAELAGVRIEMKLASAVNWNSAGAPMAPSEMSRNIDNVPGGSWQFRLTWIDTADRESAALVLPTVTVPIAAPRAGTATATVVP
jgi:hypothetical protein